MVEDNRIVIPSVVDKHWLETKRCLECRRDYIIRRKFVVPEGVIQNKNNEPLLSKAFCRCKIVQDFP
jgi:hypothetical protein